MRNVTIVESNVEPNKEHLWFYNGKLKWFGPNGWEEIYSQALSPTTTPKPVVPPTTTTTTPEPVTGSIRFTNKTNVYIQFTDIYYGTENATTSPPIQPEQTCVLKYRNDIASVSEANLISFNSLKITAIRNGEIVQEHVPYEIHVHDVGHSNYEFSFKGLLDNGVTDVYIYDDLSTTTTTTTTTTTSSTPKPEGPTIATPFGVRIYNNLADKVDITATAAEVVNKSIEPNGVTTFQILPVSTGGTFSLHVKSENLHDTVSTIKVYAHGRVGDYNMEYNDAIVNGGVFTFSYDKNAALSSISMNIELSKYVESSLQLQPPPLQLR